MEMGGGGGMKSWACLNSNPGLAGRGSVSNIGSEAPMWMLVVHYTGTVLEHNRTPDVWEEQWCHEEEKEDGKGMGRLHGQMCHFNS